MMASGAALTSSMTSKGGRRLHHQSQLSNGSQSHSQNFSLGDASNFTESFTFSSAVPTNPVITIVYSNSSSLQENQQLLLNSYASCRRLIDHMKQVVGMTQDETLDLMDNEGKVKDLSLHFDDYATQYLTARSTYYVLKVEADSVSGEKRYMPSFNLDQIDQKLGTILTNSLNTLNKSVKNQKRLAGPSRQNTSVPASSNTPQGKAKRATNRKQN